MPESGDWDAETALPRFFDIAISYQILSRIPPAKRNQAIRENEFYGANKTIAESDKPETLTEGREGIFVSVSRGALTQTE